jgi:hypothetical protein
MPLVRSWHLLRVEASSSSARPPLQRVLRELSAVQQLLLGQIDALFLVRAHTPPLSPGEDMALAQVTSHPSPVLPLISCRLQKLMGNCLGKVSSLLSHLHHSFHCDMSNFHFIALHFLLQKQVTRLFRTCPKCSVTWKPLNRRHLF